MIDQFKTLIFKEPLFIDFKYAWPINDQIGECASPYLVKPTATMEDIKKAYPDVRDWTEVELVDIEIIIR